MSLLLLRQTLIAKANQKRAQVSLRFFKTGEGEYGYGDQFLGLTVPEQRIIANEFKYLAPADIDDLLNSKWHEERLIALFILIYQFAKGDEPRRKEIYQYYLASTAFINNWDLVDSSAAKIVGQYLLNKPRDILYVLVKSQMLWERRIAVIATYAFIQRGDFGDTVSLVAALLPDKHDLIQKACGWMLREIGKKDEQALEAFLQKHYQVMPRTMLRYAIERLLPERRKQYLSGEV
ncbi:MAG: DNA alkylation repair protein [Candidatus Abawacabacteria bacterium]|nr:DNA alkylation repair protein [Candidatus Abawacabacteria bacterium]